MSGRELTRKSVQVDSFEGTLSTRAGLVVFSLWAGLLGVIVTLLLAPGRLLDPDFIVAWGGARALASGANPYDLVGPGRPFDHPLPLFYPLPALLVALPFAPLPLYWANAIFMGCATAGLAVLTIREGRVSPLVWVFPSAAYLNCLQAGQWSPWIILAVTFPALGFIAAAKPPIALALWVAYPSWRVPIVALTVTGITIALWPWWPASWLESLRAMEQASFPPITQAGGPVLFAALWKWRDPSARLLLALACVPQTTHIYETVPLFLIPQTHVEGAILVGLSYTAKLLWNAWWPYPDHLAGVLAQSQWIVLLMYLPCLVMILRRPDTWRSTRRETIGSRGKRNSSGVVSPSWSAP